VNVVAILRDANVHVGAVADSGGGKNAGVHVVNEAVIPRAARVLLVHTTELVVTAPVKPAEERIVMCILIY